VPCQVNAFIPASSMAVCSVGFTPQVVG